MKAVIPSSVLALLCASAPAQVAVSAFADTQLQVSANAARQTLPAGTPLLNQNALTIVDPGPMCPASATSRVVGQAAGLDTVVRFENTSVTTGNSLFCNAIASTGNHAVRVIFNASAPILGRLSVTTSAPIALTANFEVDVGADGTVELGSGSLTPNQVPGELEVPILLDPNGVVVRIAVHTIAVAPAGSQTRTMNVEVRFRPGPGRLRPFATPCGASLTGFYVDDPARRRAIVFRANSTVANAFGFFVLGFAGANTPLPPQGCPLFTAPVLILPTPVSAGGDAELRIPLPGPPPPLQFIAQFAAATQAPGGIAWRTSEGIGVILP